MKTTSSVGVLPPLSSYRTPVPRQRTPNTRQPLLPQSTRALTIHHLLSRTNRSPATDPASAGPWRDAAQFEVGVVRLVRRRKLIAPALSATPPRHFLRSASWRLTQGVQPPAGLRRPAASRIGLSGRLPAGKRRGAAKKKRGPPSPGCPSPVSVRSGDLMACSRLWDSVGCRPSPSLKTPLLVRASTDPHHSLSDVGRRDRRPAGGRGLGATGFPPGAGAKVRDATAKI